MDLRGKFASQISRAEILKLVADGTAEDDYLEFKGELFHPKKSQKNLEDDKADLLADLVAFANASGGLVVVGIVQDAQGKASTLAPMTGSEAGNLANSIRDLAVAHVKPGIIQLEVMPFSLKDDGGEWLVLIRVPDGLDKPYMSIFQDQTRFAIRSGNRKRSMAYDEIQQRFLFNPQQARMAQILSEIESIRSLISDIGSKAER